MRIVITPAGSRGDFQPLLALAVGLRDAGHDVLLVCAPNYESEATAFGVPVRTVGVDVEAYLRDHGGEAARLRGTYQLFKIARQRAPALIDEGLSVCRGADVTVLISS